MRRLRVGPDPDERGAVVVFVAFLIVTLLAIAALVIDVGSLEDEHRQLQNGADAAALAVAHGCALGTCDPGQATALANANAGDNAATVDSVTYPATGQVKVKTSTRLASGGTILPFFFGQAVTGEKGKTAHATAVAGWSGISKASVIPLVISMCEWNSATSNGTVFNTTFTGPISVIKFHSGGQAAADCAAQSGQDMDGDLRLPGGYGWVRTDGCNVAFKVGDLVAEDPGVSGSNTCDLRPLVGTTVLVPIYDDVNGLGGSNGVYHIKGFGELRLTGYRFPGGRGTAGTPPPCSSPTTCLGGYFTRFVTTGEAIGGPNLGAISVVLIS